MAVISEPFLEYLFRLSLILWIGLMFSQTIQMKFKTSNESVMEFMKRLHYIAGLLAVLCLVSFFFGSGVREKSWSIILGLLVLCQTLLHLDFSRRQKKQLGLCPKCVQFTGSLILLALAGAAIYKGIFIF
jgi:small-conductance mechanosensitive channel